MPNPLVDGLAIEGDAALLAQPRRALLVSRTPRRPAPGTPWVRAVVEAVRASVTSGETIVTGVGRDPYELALRETQRQRGAAIVVLGKPPGPDADDAWRELLPERHAVVWDKSERANAPAASRRRHDVVRLRARDLLIGQLADRAWEIAVRSGGIMSALAEDLRRRNGPVSTQFAVAAGHGKEARGGSGIDSAARIEHRVSATQAAAADIVARSVDSHLSHYTREPDGAWPGETRGAYLDWLATGPLDDRRDAFAALARILEEGRIRGSGRLMPRREAMVSFTAAPPAEVAGLRRFRASLHRWDFRPYGLAIRRDVLERLGARAVRYLPETKLKRLTPVERRYAQKHEPPKTDWSREAEWRLAGDLRLSDVPREAIVVLTPTRADAERLAGCGGYGTCAICADITAAAGAVSAPATRRSCDRTR